MPIFQSNIPNIQQLFPNSSSSFLTSNNFNCSHNTMNNPSLSNNNPEFKAKFERNVQQNGIFDLNFKPSLDKIEPTTQNRTMKNIQEGLIPMPRLLEMQDSLEEYRFKDYQINKTRREYNPNIGKFQSQNNIQLNSNNIFNSNNAKWNHNESFVKNNVKLTNFTSLFNIDNTTPNLRNLSKTNENSLFSYASSNIFGDKKLSTNTTTSSLFPSNNNTTSGLFPSNNNTNNTTSGLFPNNNNTTTSVLFPSNNNSTTSVLFPNNNNTTSGLFPSNNNTTSGLFPNNNNTTTSSANLLFSQNLPISNQSNITENKTLNIPGLLFPCNNNSTNTNSELSKPNSSFFPGLFVNNPNNTTTNSNIWTNNNKEAANSESSNNSNAIISNNLFTLLNNYPDDRKCFPTEISNNKILSSIKSNISNIEPQKDFFSSSTSSHFPETSSITLNQQNTNNPFFQASTISPQNINFKQINPHFNVNFNNQTDNFCNLNTIQIYNKEKIIQDFINELKENKENNVYSIYHEEINTNKLGHDFIGTYIPKYKVPTIDSRKKKYHGIIKRESTVNYNESFNHNCNIKPFIRTKREERYNEDYKIRTYRKSENSNFIQNKKKRSLSSSSLEIKIKSNNSIIKHSTLIRSIPILFKVENKEYTLAFEANMNNEVKILKEAFEEKFNKSFMNQISIKSILLMIPNQLLLDDKKLISYNFIDSTVIEAEITYEFTSKEAQLNFKTLNKNKDELAPKDLIPVLTKKDYKISPSYLALCRMTTDELKQVQNFKVYNDYGKIEFLEKVNLIGINLDEVIDIKKFYISIYSNENKMPLKGKELNVKRMFTIKEINLNQNELSEIKDYINNSNGKFVSYDKSKRKLKFQQG